MDFPINLETLQEQMKKQGEADEAQALRVEHKMSTYIKNMDAEVRERFMALKVMEDQIKEFSEAE